MTTLTINVDTDVEREFRKYAKEQYHGKKGFLGDAITMAMKKSLEQREQEGIKQRAQQLWLKGHHFGKILYKERGELHER